MKSFSLFFFLLILLNVRSTYAQDIPCNDVAALTTKLKAVRDSDQNIRMALNKQSAIPADTAQIKKIVKMVLASDKQNQLFISNLLDKCGWPQGLGFLENNTIFLVIDHADTAFMTKYYPLLKEQADKGVVLKSDLATLYDRIQMRRGLKQLYGTQTFSNSSTNTTTFWPIEDPDHLAERRSKMGLITMDDYSKLFKNASNAGAVWDKTLTVDDAKKLMKKKSNPKS